MDSELSLEFLRVVEQAAIAAGRTMGQGDAHEADRAVVAAMRRALGSVPIDGTAIGSVRASAPVRSSWSAPTADRLRGHHPSVPGPRLPGVLLPA